jgi:hypothetical protein
LYRIIHQKKPYKFECEKQEQISEEGRRKNAIIDGKNHRKKRKTFREDITLLI